MQNHTKIYCGFFEYQIPEDCVCEICGRQAHDVHHIQARGMGGNPSGDKDVIENLMGLCREHHNEYGDIKDVRNILKIIHLSFMHYNKPEKRHLFDPPLNERIDELKKITEWEIPKGG